MMKVEYLRAGMNSPYALKWRHLAIAVDKHNCLIFIVPARTEPGIGVSIDLEPLEVNCYECDESFEETFGRFIR